MGQVFKQAEQYLDQFDPEYIGQFVEIGTSRNGDDGSTRTIAEWAARFDRPLWTVDVDPVNCDFVRDMNLPNVQVICSTGEDYLQNWPGHIAYISFLYLDNFDWDWHPENPESFVVEQQARYQRLGMDMNNVNSQRAHLAQAMLAVPKMADRALIVCDDTWFNPYWGHYSGKSGSAIPYLLNSGFDVLYTEEQPVYGTILGRGIQ
jgi:hypothetical protein